MRHRVTAWDTVTVLSIEGYCRELVRRPRMLEREYPTLVTSQR